MGMYRQSIDPVTDSEEMFVEFKNTSSIALTHGMVLIRDTAETAGNCMTTTITDAHGRIEGVVHDPAGNSVAVGANGELRKKGCARIKIISTAATAMSAAAPLMSTSTSGCAATFTTSIATLFSSGMTIANAKLYGHPGIFGYVVTETTSAQTYIDGYVDAEVAP